MKEELLEKRRHYDNLVFKGIKKVDKCIDTLLKDVDNGHVRFLLVNRILNGAISDNTQFYVNEGVKEEIEIALKHLLSISEEEYNEQD